MAVVLSRILTLVVALSSFPVTSDAHAGKLDRARREVDKPKKKSEPASTSSRRSRDDDDDDDDDDSATSSDLDCVECVEAMVYLLTLPWRVPYELLEGEQTRRYHYAPYPYAGRRKGYLQHHEPRQLADNGESTATWTTDAAVPASWSELEADDAEPNSATDVNFDDEPQSGAQVEHLDSWRGPPARDIPTPEDESDDAGLSEKRFALTVSGEAGTVWGGILRSGAALRILTPLRLELDTHWSFLAEPSDEGTDFLALGTSHLTWRFAQSSALQFRTGVGPRHFIDAAGGDVGLDVMYGFDAMIGRPFVLSAYGHLGAVGQAFIWQARGSLGVMVKRTEIFAGYDHSQIGDVALGGPNAGIRLWL
jgi:hypothetical protein